MKFHPSWLILWFFGCLFLAGFAVVGVAAWPIAALGAALACGVAVISLVDFFERN